MMLAAIYIAVVIVLEASPIYPIFMSGAFNRDLPPMRWVWVIGSFVLVVLTGILTVIYPIKYGESKLSGKMPYAPVFEGQT